MSLSQTSRQSPEVRPRLVSQSLDGKLERYRYRAYEFEVERGWVMWWCHSGINVPTDPTDEFWEMLSCEPPAFELVGICHEAGWGSLTKRSLLRKLRRSVNADIRGRARRQQIEDGPAFARRCP